MVTMAYLWIISSHLAPRCTPAPPPLLDIPWFIHPCPLIRLEGGMQLTAFGPIFRIYFSTILQCTAYLQGFQYHHFSNYLELSTFFFKLQVVKTLSALHLRIKFQEWGG